MLSQVFSSYSPATAPYEHQREALAASYSKRAFALLMDPGLGKSKTTIDTAAILFEAHLITGLLILAPNDVHEQWVSEQLPLHLPSRIHWQAFVWRNQVRPPSSSSVRKWTGARAAVAAFLDICDPAPKDALHVLAMNHEALATPQGRAAARYFLTRRSALFVLDDSHEFRTLAAARTKAATALAPLAFARRILTGTLTGGSPFHLYSQFKFLSPAILNCNTYLLFKHTYATWKKRTVRSPKKGLLVDFEECTGFKNLPALQQLIAPYCYVKHKEDCGDLPPKIFQTVPTHLSPAQAALCGELIEEGVALLDAAEHGTPLTVTPLHLLTEEDLAERLADPRNRVSFQIKLTLLLRLQQAAAGITTDDTGVTRWIDGAPASCPRFQSALAYIAQALTAGGKVLVWANFRACLQALAQALPEQSVLIHGGVTGEARQQALTAFKDPSSPVRILIAHPRTMGTGQNFEVAQTVLYYTRSFSYFQRQQSEDRAHRLSSKGAVTIGDMVARDSATDQKEMQALQAKLDLVTQLEHFDPRTLKAPS